MQLSPKVKERWNRVKGNKVVVLPVVIVVLLIVTVALSISQSEKQKKSGQNSITNPQETIAPVPTGPTVISRVGTLKAVKYGSKEQYFLVLKNGDALKLDVKDNIDIYQYLNSRVSISGVLNPDNNVFTVENISLSKDEEIEPSKTPIPYPNDSPSPTPTDLPLSSPVNE